MKVAIIDYGSGNLTSVAGAVQALGSEPLVTANPQDIVAAERIILPGVGAFGDGMRQLRAAGMVDALETARRKTRPILGICLGAQMMCRTSEEFGPHEGLGWIDATVRLLRPSDPSLRVPHVGWDNFRRSRSSFLFDDIPEGALFYFVHSYAIHCAQSVPVIGACDYGETFTAAFGTGQVYGVQFHPEKSQKHGLALLRNFITKTG
jgi:glutamine amidotransferase